MRLKRVGPFVSGTALACAITVGASFSTALARDQIRVIEPELFKVVGGAEAAHNLDSAWQDSYLEGPAFGRSGENLYFTENTKVFRLHIADKKLDVIATYPGAALSSIAIHKDGRLFVAAISDKGYGGGGRIFAINPDGSAELRLLQTKKRW